MSKRKKCQVVIEDGSGVTVRKGRDLADVIATALLAHLEHPLVLLAVVTMQAGSETPLSDDDPEKKLLDGFLNAAAAYADAVTSRWERMAEIRAEVHEGCCECGECVEPEDGEPHQDDRARLIEEELRAARAAGDMSNGSKS